MTLLTISTRRLRLQLESTSDVLARIDAMDPADRAELSPDWIARLEASAPSAWTHGFALVEDATGADVGSCAYKGPPDGDGVVEIAYGINAPFRGRGYAKEAAEALVAYALGAGARHVIAHTLPSNDASASVLKACGFVNRGEVMDPEDGLVWRWEFAPPPAR